MNIQLQCCGLVIIALLLFFFFYQRRVGLFTERIFIHTISISGLCVILDALSIVAISYSEMINPFLLKFVCKSYLVSIVWVAEQALFYVLMDLHAEKEYLRLIARIRFVGTIQSVIVLLMPISIYQEGDVVYTYGASVLLTYFFAFTYIIALLICTFWFKREITINRRIAVWIWMAIWIGAACIQFLNNQFLLVGFACSLGMMALYLKLENPESNRDREYDCFHAHALMQYLNQCYEREETKAILYVAFHTQGGGNQKLQSLNDSILTLATWLNQFKKAKVFKSTGPELVIVFPDIQQMTQIYQKMQETFFADQRYIEEEGRFEENTDRLPKALFALIPDSRIVESAEELLQLLQYIKIENMKSAVSDVIYVNDMILKSMRERDEVSANIISALDEDRVEVFYQPIYSTTKGHFVSAEALVRIRNTDGSIVPPGVFIPIAEENGLIARIGERVFEKVCAFLKDSRVTQLGIAYIEVNLSVVQCEQHNLAERYIAIMEKYQVKPWQINLEITESASVQTKQILLENMERLIAYGVSFSLDDFGIGQSNLDYVIDMPVSIMKFDMSMTQAYFKDLKAQFVMRAAIRMAHEMDLFLVAEGVEDEHQLAEMQNEGIDYIQGYYFSKPLPQEEFLRFLEDCA